jgi:sortase B
MSDNTTQTKRSKRLWIVVLLLSLLLLLGGAAAYIVTHPWWNRPLDPAEFHTQEPTPSAPVPTTTQAPVTEPAETPEVTDTTVPETTEAPLPENPVDFAALQEINPDIYAWIYLPMSPEREDIDYPILQSRTEDDDNFYLHKDIYRKYLFMGSLYTQKANAKDFSDRMTVIYGHNMLNQVMFSNLVYFRDSQIFENHEFFYIYTPGHILTYRIAAAIQFDTRHLLNCFDFSDDAVFAEWIQNYVLEPRTMVRSVREGMEVTIDDKIVVLSTCIEHGKFRYLVQGVLISDEPTQ